MNTKVAVVTGANSGLGFETAVGLAEQGYEVVMACRDRQRAEQATQQLLTRVPHATVHTVILDLASMASVRAAAAEISQRWSAIEILVNNAGVMGCSRELTEDGFERQFATNHLGHFTLTGLLINRVEKRVVTVSSVLHRLGRIRFDDLHGAHRYQRWLWYSQSKLANLLFTLELDRRLQNADHTTKAVACHPGYAATNLLRTRKGIQSGSIRDRGWRLIEAGVAQSAAEGALPCIAAATQPTDGGDFWGPAKLFGLRGAPIRVSTARKASNPEVASRLWDISVELSGVDYGALQ